MYTKLTLRLDEQLIQNVKNYAKDNNTSLSRMVSDYFRLLMIDEPGLDRSTESLPPITQSLIGMLSGAQVDEDDYYAYLEEKHQ